MLDDVVKALSQKLITFMLPLAREWLLYIKGVLCALAHILYMVCEILMIHMTIV